MKDEDAPWNQPGAPRTRRRKKVAAPAKKHSSPPVKNSAAEDLLAPLFEEKPAPAVPLYAEKADRGPKPGRWKELAPEFSAALAVDFRYSEAFAREFHRMQDPTARQTKLPRV